VTTGDGDAIYLARRETIPSGPTLAVKDLFDTAELPTTYGSSIFVGHVPARTAEAVRRAEAAGWVVNGKTNLHEFAYGISSQNPHFGTVPNPIAPGRLAGGSSGGSAAAIAAGLCDAALGTDSGGSIRIPSAWCGTVGFKPTFGLVPIDGTFPLAPSYDHAGPMAASVETCVELMRALVPGFSATPLDSLEQLRVGIAWLETCDPLVRARVEAAAALFPQACPVDFPLADPADSFGFMREIADVHRSLLSEHEDEYGDNVRTKVKRCLAVGDADVEAGRRARTAYRKTAEDTLAGLDLLVTPTIGFVAPPDDVDELEIRERATRFTYPFDSLGWPALALPCGPAEDALPASVQVVGRAGDDELVLSAGRLLASLVRGTAPG
jgi:aspartyl-tRNA(Asn)/glutamyl-tRNA(Gln) amidotransferase subunit A